MKKLLISAVVVYVAWFIINFAIHGVLLQQDYADTAQLWRPQGEYKFWVFQASSLIAAVCFTAIYSWLVSHKSFGKALVYGILSGLSFGATAGIGSYSYMPITCHIATMWLVGGLATGVVGGFLLAVTQRD